MDDDYGQSYHDFTKYSQVGSYVSIGHISGRDLGSQRVSSDGIRLRLGEYIEACPIISLVGDTDIIRSKVTGTLEITLDIYLRLSRRREDRERLEFVEFELELQLNDGAGDRFVKKIRDTKVGLGIHLVQFQVYVPVIRSDTLWFTLRVLDGSDIDVRYYNRPGDVFTTGTVRLL